MPLVTGNAPPSTLTQIIQAATDYLRAARDTTPVQVGKQYLAEFGVGSPPCVLFVPEQNGRLGPPVYLGSDASYTHGCDFYVRAPAGGEDATRFEPAYQLASRIVGALKRAGAGRLVFTGPAKDASASGLDSPGVAVSAHFEYTHDLPKDAAVYAVPAQPPTTLDPSAVVANPPPGRPASGVPVFAPTTTPTA